MILQNDFERYLDHLVAGKSVLAIGETGMDFETDYKDLTEWRFRRLRDKASKLVGIDYNKKNVRAAAKKGFDFRFADIQDRASLQSAIGRSIFDVIILVDVIEHLSNTADALAVLRDVLAPAGILIITTPTPWYFRDIQTVLLQRRPIMASDHTQYIVPSHFAQLGLRCDLRLVADGTVHFLYRPSSIRSSLLKLIAWWNPELLNHYVFVMRRR
jgi:SAM-dependent methyltransferase